MILSTLRQQLDGKWNLIYDSRVASERGLSVHQNTSTSLLEYPQCCVDREYLVFEGDEVVQGFPDAADLLGQETCRSQLRFGLFNKQVVLEWLGNADQESLDALLGPGPLQVHSEKPNGFSEYWSRYAFRLEDRRLQLRFLGMPYMFVEASPDAEVDLPESSDLPVDNTQVQVSVYERE